MFILLLLGDINVNPGPTTVNNNIAPFNTLPFHNCDNPTMPSECNSSDCFKAHDKSILNSKTDIEDYHLCRLDSPRRGGGVASYIYLTAKNFFRNIERSFIDIVLPKSKLILVRVFY